MSKPAGGKARASEPVRLPSNPPPNSRKASGVTPGARSSSKFYDGPTVPKNTVEAKEQAKAIAGKTVSVAKSSSRKAVRVVKRHPWSITSILTTIPVLLFISLFSTVLCPPPESQPSGISRFVQSRLGISHGPSELRQTLCYPSNRYHKEILQPYVYPALERGRKNLESTYPYTSIIQPGYAFSRTAGDKIYTTYLEPIISRLYKGGRRVYLTQVQPHLPYLRTKWYTLTAPISDRVQAAHGQYLAPHLSTAGRYTKSASNSAVSGWRYAARHPFTALANRHAQKTYRLGKQKGGEAYVWSRPHVHRMARQAEKFTREQVVPRATAALKFVVDHIEDGFYFAKAQIASQYKTHLDPHLHPYTSKVSAATSPYIALLNQKIYTPYLREYVHYFLPAAILAPEPPKSFWGMISDFLPSPGSNAAERKGSMTEKIRQAATGAKASSGDKAQVAREQASRISAAAKSKVSSASVVAAKSASSAASVASRSASSVSNAAKSQSSSVTSAGKKVVEQVTASGKSLSRSASASVSSASNSVSSAAASVSSVAGENGRMTKAEFDTARNAIAARLEAQGKASTEKLRSELIAVQNRFLADTYPKMVDTNKKELDKEINYILSGMDKLYSESGALTRDQVKQSGAMAETRMQQKLAIIKGRGGEVPRVTKDQGKPALKREMDVVDAVLGKDWTDLAMKIATIEGITAKDRKQFNELRKSADGIKGKLTDLHEGKQYDRLVQTAESKLSAAIKELTTELDDLYAGFRDRVKILQKSANDKIQAREMIKGSQIAASAAKSSAHTANGERATILPIIPGAVAADAPDIGIIGKGKEQVMQALSQANAAVKGDSASAVAEEIVASASSVSGVASSATGSATQVVQSIRDAAASQAQSVVAVAGDNAHAATESIKSALGNLHSVTESIKSAAPLPTANEYLASIANDVAAGAASVYGVVEENVQQATRSVNSVAGVTSTPDSPIESAQSYAREISKTAESLASVISASASSIASAASASAVSAGSNVGDNLSYVASAVSSVVHEGTRSVISAAGATPSLEGAQEHFEAYKAAAAENLGKLMGDVQGSAASVVCVAGEAVHSGTRAIVKAAGGTLTPETPRETVESVVAVASQSVSSAYNAAASAGGKVVDQAALLASSIQSALGYHATPLPTPVASSASAYLASLSSAGASVGSEAISTGSLILAALQSQIASGSGEAGKKTKEAAEQVRGAVGGRVEL